MPEIDTELELAAEDTAYTDCYELPFVAPAGSLLNYAMTDVGNAERLIQFTDGNVRFCPDTRKWMVWTGKRWEADENERMMERALRMLARFGGEADRAREGGAKPKLFGDRALAWKSKSENVQRLDAMVKVARSSSAISALSLNAYPDEIGVENGIVDLRDQSLRAHDRERLMTRTVRWEYRKGARCTTWIRFLERCFGLGVGADPSCVQDLIGFLQVALGYTLTGHTREKCIFIFWGDKGNNGKSTLLHTIRQILAPDYSTLIQIDSLIGGGARSNNAQADLADLMGVRFAMTSETDRGQRISEGIVKRLTQGMGAIKSARKYQNPIEFPETHKLFIDANHRPQVDGNDDAI